ncbi:hypothetical protein [Agrococcus beijingensis]|uniref:hypothetical protein n=1 Tax=Agrococcus beijingensis TaxID=3068634 RepID=UPI002740F0D7|nr:hypothetical protein [Agrococcus sp. REN33]
MARTASRHEEELRQALELVASATPRELDHVYASHSTTLPDAAAAVRNALAQWNAVVQLESALVALPAPIDPATTRAAQATENVWRRLATEFGMLSSSEVSELLGASNANRVYASERRKRGELLAVQRKNAYVFPAFQFDHETGVVHPWVAPLLKLAEHHGRSAAGVISWMMAPTTYFDGGRPVDHVEAPDRLLDVAERAWGIDW